MTSAGWAPWPFALLLLLCFAPATWSAPRPVAISALTRPSTQSTRKSLEVARLLNEAEQITGQLLTELKTSRRHSQTLAAELHGLKESLRTSQLALIETLTQLSASRQSLQALDGSYARLESRIASLIEAAKRERIVWGGSGLVVGFVLGLIE